jgi:uncharacterized MAPEG superfamily protein
MSLRDFKGVIRIAVTPREWVAAIQASLAEEDPAFAAQRVQVAYENRLETRIAAIEAALEEKLKGKNGRESSGARTGREVHAKKT